MEKYPIFGDFLRMKKYPKIGKYPKNGYKKSIRKTETLYPKSGTFQKTPPSYEILKDKNNDNDNAKIEKLKVEEIQKKSSKVSVKKPSLPEVEFLDSEFKDFNVFEDYLKQAHPEIDTSFYYHKISAWLDKDTGEKPKRKIWKSTVNQFLENDYKRGQLVTTKSKDHAKPTNSTYPKQSNSFEQQATATGLDDLLSRFLANR